MELNAAQRAVRDAQATTFIVGPAGSGKTTALHHRLLQLLHSGEPAYTMLMLIAELPQRTAVLDAVHAADIGPYSDLKVITYPSLAREMVTLFWPLIARDAGFERPYLPPTVLSYDLAQLLMWDLVMQAIQEGTFANVRLRPQQIVSQILDTLNRAALNRLSIEASIERQISTWTGDAEHIRNLRQVERTAQQFRSICLGNNLLDMSLITEVFDQRLVENEQFHRYFSERFRHMLVDNVEEQTPAGQQFIAKLMPFTQSTTVSYDVGGGYKRFLSADPQHAMQFASLCTQTIPFEDSFVTPGPLSDVSALVSRYLVGGEADSKRAAEGIWATITGRYRRDMIDNLVNYLTHLMDEQNLAPSDIALVAPYLDGALHFGLTQRLKAAGLPYYVLKRRSSPREEPRIRAWLTWLALAHPNWGTTPAAYDVAEALSLSIAEFDPVRAALLAEHLYNEQTATLAPAAALPDPVAKRIGADMVALFEHLRLWLAAEGGIHTIDTFLYRLFNELLATPEYQPTPDVAGAAICDWLVQTAGRLRDSASSIGLETEAEIGLALINGINQGLVTANPPDLGDPPDPEGIMISTAYGYLLSERRVHVQVWLESAASGWWDIPRQPLNNVFVLAASWPPHRLWDAEEEMKIRNGLLNQVIAGLTNRCTGGVILANSELDRRGQNQDGHLWLALQFARSP